MFQRKVVLFILMGVFLTQFSCKEKIKRYKPTTTIVEGQISDAESPVIILSGDVEIKSVLDPTGKFIIQAELEKAGIYSLTLSNQTLQIFIVPGDRISLNTTQSTFNTNPKFEGDHMLENNYLIVHDSLKRNTEPIDFKKYFTQTEDELIRSVEQRMSLFNTNQQEYQKLNRPFDEVFAELITEEVMFDAAALKLEYPVYYYYFLPESKMKLTDTYDSFLQNLEIDNDDNLLLPSYKKFVETFLEFKSRFDTPDNTESLNINKFDNISNLFQSKMVREFLYYNLMKDLLETSINDVSLLMDKYHLLQSNIQYLNEIDADFKSWEKLLKGNSSPDIICSNLKGKTITLEDFKDKVVYIDIWATWCGPCLREIPFLEKMQAKYQGRNDVAFISISIDQDKNSWKSMVEQKNMKGFQFYADHISQKHLVEHFLIKGIPRFIIIDKGGKIWNANAPRPSDENVFNELNEALQN